MKLLVTRPQPDAERTAQALRAAGHAVLLAPLTRIEFATADLGPGPWAAVLITSANAARSLENHPRRQELISQPLIAVGDRSAAAARLAGFIDVTSADGAVEDLLALVAARYGGRGRPLLYLAGANRASDLVAALAAVAPVEMHVIYQALAQPFLPPEAAAALRDGTLGGVVHFSRRAARVYLDAASQAGLPDAALSPIHYCLSARIAEPLAAAGALSISVAQRPTENALISLVNSD